MTKLRVLCLDIEGGRGGSSNSLYQSLFYQDKAKVDLEIWCRLPGIKDRYQEIGISCEVHPQLKSFGPVQRFSRNIYSLIVFFLHHMKLRDFYQKLFHKMQDFDVLHCNHEGLFLLIRTLKKMGLKKKIVCHIRRTPHRNWFSAFQYKILNSYVDDFVFITENERLSFELLNKSRIYSGKVIYNIAPELNDKISSFPQIESLKEKKVICLSNAGYPRGVDRVVDIAKAVKEAERSDIKFIFAGEMTLSKSDPGLLGEVAREGGDMKDYAARLGVADNCIFLGHISNPLDAIYSSDLLIKPQRSHQPWGRDIIEAMGLGKPVMAYGAYNVFVENEMTGVLMVEFNPYMNAKELIKLIDDPEKLKAYGENAKARVKEICDGKTQAEKLFSVWS